MRILEENIEVNLFNLGLGIDFLEMTLKAQVIKENTGKLGFFKMKNLYASEDITEKMKWQTTDLEKLLANHIFKQGLVFKIYKELLQLNNFKKTQFFNRQGIWIDICPSKICLSG